MSAHLRNFPAAAAACILAFGLGGTAAQAVPLNVFSDDFSGGAVPAGFSGVGAVVDAQGYKGLADFADNFLRNTANGNPAAATILTLSGLAAHDTVSLDFLLAVIDTWDGSPPNVAAPDIFNVEIDGVSIFSESYANLQNLATQTAPTSNQVIAPTQLGFDLDFSTDSGYDMGDLAAFNGIAHSADTLTIEWFASGAGWQGGSDESWAIDNVSVTINTTEVDTGGDGDGDSSTDIPEPATFSLFGAGLVGFTL